MSRIYNQHHPSKHNPKYREPVQFLDKEENIPRKRKIKPYGLKGSNSFNDNDKLVEIVNKKKVRKDWKRERKQLLEDII